MMTWEDFKLKFSKYHVPQGLIKKMRDEFRELKQGRMSVVEYRDRFLTLSSYRPNHHNNNGGPPKPGGNNNNNNHINNNNHPNNSNNNGNNNNTNTGPRTGSNAIPVNPKDKSTVNCYECGVVGHYSNECPKKLAKIAANTAAPAQQQRRFAGRRNQNNNNGRLYHMTATEAQEAPQNMPKSEDAGAGVVVLSPSRHLPPFAAAPFPPEIMVDSDDEYYFKNFIDTSSEEESDDEFFTDAAVLIHEHIVSQIPVFRGSLPGRAAALDRKRERGHDQLYNDYFQPNPLFVPHLFRRRFRMNRPLFRRIMDGVKIYDDYFCAKVDALGKVGLSSYQKCTAAIRMLAYGVAGDFVDEYTRMSESTGWNRCTGSAEL
ncbi:hypothetical protein QYE76_001671 [Lolium multiflorum]|uniref:CCHC-type domain-containing protein n=1 Tax=Lolium multiflorum TaxID=4521 RepID=A0AAD8RP69_LOLMU|nr:hypothetical protein QYE76_001671 [Lolium multiflorum]